MLMITRKRDESFVIKIGDDLITITVTEIGTSSSKKQVQLGIDAPKQYKVWRSEIHTAMEENKKAVTEHSGTASLRSLFPKK